MPKTVKGHSTSTSTNRAAPYSTTIPSTSASASVSTSSRQGKTPSHINNMSSADSPSHTTRTSNSSWNPESDRQLMDARAKGLNWGPIANTLFPDKTSNACRKRHERLMVKRNHSQDWEGVKLEQLAQAYQEMREPMWTLLAKRLGERWQTVEAKCMEKGFKNLQVASRAVERRGKEASTATAPPYSEPPDINNDLSGDSGLPDAASTPSNNGDDHISLSGNQPHQQHHKSPFQLPQPQAIQPPSHHAYPSSSSHSHQISTSRSGGDAHHQRGMSYPISSSSAASSTAASPTFTAPSNSRNWSLSSNHAGPSSTLFQALSPPPPPLPPLPPPVQPLTMNHSSAGGGGGYGYVPTTTGPGKPTIASMLQGRPMGEPSAVTTS